MSRSARFPGRVLPLVVALGASLVGAWLQSAEASSHREAPFITTVPKVDATDLYLFNSYEASRAGYVTLLANSPSAASKCSFRSPRSALSSDRIRRS